PEVQADRCFEIIGAALGELGASLDHVVRTRMYVTDPAVAGAVGRAHARAVGHVRPAATMVVVAGLLDQRWRGEIEAGAGLPGQEPKHRSRNARTSGLVEGIAAWVTARCQELSRPASSRALNRSTR